MALIEKLVPIEWSEADELAALSPAVIGGESPTAVKH
jgi:hypothetical protein